MAEVPAPRLCLGVCQFFETEARAVLAAERWDDVQLTVFPARCGGPAPDRATSAAPAPPQTTAWLPLGQVCPAGQDEACGGQPALRRMPLRPCFHLVAPAALVDEAIAGGAYLVTPGWLTDWPAHLRQLGTTPDAAPAFFGAFARELLLLDTGTSPEAPAHAAEFAAVVKLPLRRVGLGLDCMRMHLQGLVLQWRLHRQQDAAQAQQRAQLQELAQQRSAMDLLAGLTRVLDEAAAVAALRELFQRLFAPETVELVLLRHGQPEPHADIDAAVRQALDGLDQAYAWSADGRGFLLRLGTGEGAVAKIAVLGLAIPERRQRCLNLALTLAGPCAMVIETARLRRRLAEADRMAALSLVVAGAAHELSTPLGVDLVATSRLREQIEAVEQRFAARSLKQSDLAGFLRKAGAALALVHGNLERMGRLVDRFRQVAVEDRSPTDTRIRLRDCLDDAVRALGGRLDPARVELHIRCDPALEARGRADDWASVFGNLLANSLQHGFRERAHGRIDIAIEALPDRLRVDYRDDGCGMSAQARARVFDPFFTTDMQRGMGLGMHLVRNLLSQRFGCEIACDSAPGRGVHFHFELPS